MGLETYRRFLRENQKKMADLAKSFGIHVFYHTDGAARVFVPDLIDYVGIEALNPIQWRCPTMEREPLVREAISEAFAELDAEQPQREAELGQISGELRKTGDALDRHFRAFEGRAPCRSRLARHGSAS